MSKIHLSDRINETKLNERKFLNNTKNEDLDSTLDKTIDEKDKQGIQLISNKLIKFLKEDISQESNNVMRSLKEKLQIKFSNKFIRDNSVIVGLKDQRKIVVKFVNNIFYIDIQIYK